jgi:hypothetical protein
MSHPVLEGKSNANHAHNRNVANINKPTTGSWQGEVASLILELVEVLELLEIHLDIFFLFTWA